MRAELTEGSARALQAAAYQERIRRCSAGSTRHCCKRWLLEALPHRTSRENWMHQRASGGCRRTRPVGARAAERLLTSRAQDDHCTCGARPTILADRDALHVVARDLPPLWQPGVEMAAQCLQAWSASSFVKGLYEATLSLPVTRSAPEGRRTRTLAGGTQDTHPERKG